METPPQIGRFRVLDLVGEGAMGVVFRGRDESLDRDVALKVMRAAAASAEDRERFLREARAVARLQHPNIITVYELGDHLGSPFIAMELLEGVDLQRAIAGGLRPNPRVTLPIVLQLLAGLGHAHESGIVHRDVKPSNLFLPRGRPAKIMDFGVARLSGGTATSSLIVGTPNYMSPEQVQARPTDGRSDLFSAGLILYELVTGEKAYQGDSVVALLYKIAHEDVDLALIPRGAKWDRLRATLGRALFKDPDRRYPSAAAMAADLALALQDLGGSIDGAAASDLGLMRLASSARATIPPERADEPPPTATHARPALATPAPSATPTSPPPETAYVAEPLPRGAARRRPSWMAPAVAGTIVLIAVAAALVAMLFRSPGPGTTGGEPSPPSPLPSGDALVSGRGRLGTSGLPSPRSPGPAPSSRVAASPPPPVPSPVSSPRVAAASPLEPSASPVEPTAPEPPAAGARLDRASDLYEKGHYAAALAEAKAVLRREPGNAEAKTLVEDIEADQVVESRLKQAREAMRRGDREGALEQVRAGLAVKGTDGRLLSLFKELTQ
jgi:serine/threonine protein kinase